MKILQVNCVYGNGSTGKITSVLHHELKKQGIESIVCYGRGITCNDEGVYRICGELNAKYNHLLSKITGVMYGGCGMSTRKLISAIEKDSPDIVHLQCINGYFVNIYRLLRYLKRKNIATVLTLHAEFMFTGGCGYSLDCERWKDTPGCGNCPKWKRETGSFFRDGTRSMWKKMYQAFYNFKNLTIVSVSPWLMNRAKESSILKEHTHTFVYNGLDISTFHKCECTIHEKKVVFHVSPYFNDDPNHIKGGYYVLKLAKRMPEVQFVIAGPHAVQGDIPKNVLLLGRVSNQNELAKHYSNADLTLLTSKRETFSMICAESLCCGTPVVGFKSGAPEQISLKAYSEFVDYGDLDSLELVVRKWLIKDKSECIAEEANKWYAKEIMAQKYIEIYNKSI